MNQVGILGWFSWWSVIGCMAVTSVIAANAAPANVLAWGINDRGQTTLPQGLGDVTAADLGLDNGFALRADGTVVAWGNTNYSVSIVPSELSNVVALASGESHCLALKSDGTVVGWGNDYAGQADVPPGLSNVIAIAAGFAHSLALKTDGTVTAWGAGTHDTGTFPDYGQSMVPADLTNVMAIAAGFGHSVALTADGRVVAWGAGTKYDGGFNLGQSIVPTNLQDVVSIAASYWCTLALTSKGTVVVWGDNSAGQTNVPSDLANVVAIEGGDDHHLALKADGTVKGWGLNYFGEADPPPNLSNVVWIAAGASDSAAVFNDGSPAIVRAPFTQSALPGTDVALRVAAVGQPPLSYQWLHDGITVAGATNTSLALTDIPLKAAGGYQCMVSNLIGTVTSPAGFLTVPRTTPYFDETSSLLGFSARGFGLPLKGLSGHGELVISASTNFVDWEPILTNPPAAGSVLLFDEAAANAAVRLYRAIER